jgi:ABC-type uncharacterized transport system ATPase subunit
VRFNVFPGEIVAIAGVSGNGQTELVHAITGTRPVASGNILLNGHDVTRSGPKELFHKGLAFVPEDRQREGLVGPFSVADNLVLNRWADRPFARWIRIDRDAVRANADQLAEQFDIRAASIDVSVETLSGGNQQKVIIAREFSKGGRLVVLSQPTRGLDVGSIEYIHARTVEQRDAGAGVLLVSFELDEVMALADRVAVMYRGRIIGELAGETLTRENVGLLMAGQAVHEGAA